MANIELFKRKVLTGLEALKAWIGQNYAAKSHTHTTSQITGLTTGLTATGGQNSSDGYWRRYSDSFTMEWGWFSSGTPIYGGAANARTVYYPKVFSSTPIVILQPTSGIGQTNDMMVCENTARYFKIQNVNQSQNSNVQSCMWIALGHTNA